jgi:hypothetical protein
MDFTEITKFFFFQSADAPCFLEFDDSSSILSSQRMQQNDAGFMYSVIMVLVNYFAMEKNGCVL